MGGDCLARVSVSLFVDRESEERVQRSRVGGDCLARVPVSLFVDRESEERTEWEATVSQESQSLCLLTEKVRRV